MAEAKRVTHNYVRTHIIYFSCVHVTELRFLSRDRPGCHLDSSAYWKPSIDVTCTHGVTGVIITRVLKILFLREFVIMVP